MRLRSVLLLLLSLTFPLFAQYPAPELGTIVPDTLPTTGGTEVTISGRYFDLPPNFACIAECPPRVRFGDHEVAAHEYTDTRVVVKAPPHAAGLVGVTLTTGDGRTVSRPSAVTYVASHLDDWETVLVPVYVDESTPGAGNSLWATELWIRNNDSEAVEIAPWPCPDGMACPPVYPSRFPLAPGHSLRGLPPVRRTPNPARLLFLPKDRGANVSFNLRVLNGAARFETGTELPVVRGSAFRNTTAQLLNVPFEPSGHRFLLRLYDLSRVTTRFAVRVYEQVENESGAPVGEVILTTILTDAGPDFASAPGYVAFDVEQIVPPQLVGRPLRIEIEPLVPYARFWALLTITSDVTQHVTVVTPQ